MGTFSIIVNSASSSSCAIQILVFDFPTGLHKSGCVFDPTWLVSTQPETTPEQDVTEPLNW